MDYHLAWPLSCEAPVPVYNQWEEEIQGMLTITVELLCSAFRHVTLTFTVITTNYTQYMYIHLDNLPCSTNTIVD